MASFFRHTQFAILHPGIVEETNPFGGLSDGGYDALLHYLTKLLFHLGAHGNWASLYSEDNRVHIIKQSDVVCNWEPFNYPKVFREHIDEILLCADWKVVYINGGLCHWFHQCISHLELDLGYKLNSKFDLDNLGLSTIGESQDDRTWDVCNLS